jgi:hypothetical protein
VPKPARLFLSHSSKDRRFVERLARVLDAHKVRYWFSRRHIRGAQQWHDEIGKALARCNWMLLTMTPAAVASKWVKHELLYALEERSYENHIVVLDYRSAKYKKLSWTPHSLQWIDFRHGFDSGCRELLRVWKRRYRGEGSIARRRSGRSRRAGWKK